LAEGWIQRKAHNNGSYCIVGAIFSKLSSVGAQFSGPDWRTVDRVGVEAESEVNKLLTPPPGVVFSYIADWNDKPGRTQEEVLALMDTAIGNSMNRG